MAVAVMGTSLGPLLGAGEGGVHLRGRDREGDLADGVECRGTVTEGVALALW